MAGGLVPQWKGYSSVRRALCRSQLQHFTYKIDSDQLPSSNGNIAQPRASTNINHLNNEIFARCGK